MNQSYYHKLNSSLTPVKNNQNNTTQLSQQDLIKIIRNYSKQMRDSTDNKKGDSLFNMLLSQQQQAIQSARQFSIERPLKSSPLETSPNIQNKPTIVSSSFSYIRKSTEQSQTSCTQFDRLLNENTTLLMKIQELEQKVKYFFKYQLEKKKWQLNKKTKVAIFSYYYKQIGTMKMKIEF
ncbi:unnamed protein product (macronuclear) [Paramecium tetraurelia]|uniref:Uncharacterized protein n=1 Tax=Paramecium tetraurelia TaxID=5888 RepID=A0C3M7_PARTE|nr:uncharacterized protein GSPATT00034873001 [Paramecium tetraurelia]CAK65394.1 unnamed protein product [Paramecium tetraurelia]|eukprot:XP_001432791.1 hypothetical protein (macronuclear) [Paramecium tetraurelia strain d4-2]